MADQMLTETTKIADRTIAQLEEMGLEVAKVEQEWNIYLGSTFKKAGEIRAEMEIANNSHASDRIDILRIQRTLLLQRFGISDNNATIPPIEYVVATMFRPPCSTETEFGQLLRAIAETSKVLHDLEDFAIWREAATSTRLSTVAIQISVFRHRMEFVKTRGVYDCAMQLREEESIRMEISDKEEVQRMDRPGVETRQNEMVKKIETAMDELRRLISEAMTRVASTITAAKTAESGVISARMARENWPIMEDSEIMDDE